LSIQLAFTSFQVSDGEHGHNIHPWTNLTAMINFYVFMTAHALLLGTYSRALMVVADNLPLYSIIFIRELTD
jgi:hypothetical protein